MYNVIEKKANLQKCSDAKLQGLNETASCPKKRKATFYFKKIMLKTKRKVVITSLVAIIGFLVGALSVSLTWFAKMNSMSDLDELGGSVLSQYFDTGTGTQSDPFVITRPKHWENLVWLHNNVSNFYQAITDEQVDPEQQNDQGYYFQVGKQVNGQGEYYVYDYTNDGIINPNNTALNSRTLNLNGLGSLIPIGCDTKPFLGVINGHGITVSGFDVVGFEDKNYNLQHDSGEEGFNDVGIFGYIGNDSAVQNIYFDDFRIHLANANATRSNNSTLHNNGFHTSTENGSPDICYAGYIAGHMHYSSSVSGVYINNCTIDGGSAATTGFGYFGVVEQQNGQIRPTPLEEVQEIKQAGTDNNFGGSLDFNSVFDRLSQIYATTPKTTYYVDRQTLVKNDKTGTLTGETSNLNDSLYHHETEVEPWSGNISYRYADYDDYGGGVFNFPNDNDDSTSTNNNIYQCLYGESSHYSRTVTTYTFLDTTYECFLIQNGDNFLNHRYYPNIQAETDENYAAGWRFTGVDTGNLYTMVFDTRYYLNVTDGALTLDTSASSTWTKSTDGEIYTNINGVNHYLDYENCWCVSPYSSRYTINDGNTNYLTANPNTIGNATSSSDATKFFLSNPNGNTTIGFNYQNQIFYLSSGGGVLTVSTNPTTWSKDGSSFYITVDNKRSYLVFENNEWLIKPESGYEVGDGNGHYLSVRSGPYTTNSNNNSFSWQFTSTTGDTEIYCYYNNNKYYLTYNNGLALTDDSSNATWHRNGNGLYITRSNHDYYLTYQDTWRVTDLTFYRIHDGNGNYLVGNGTNNFQNTRNMYEATHFYFDNNAGNPPTGKINYVYNGTIYYLNGNTTNNNIQLQSSISSSSTTWSNDGSSIYFTSSSVTYYICFEDTWFLKKSYSGYLITDGTNYMVVSGTTISNTTNINNATPFTFSSTGTNPSGTIRPSTNTSYYLRYRSGSLQISTNSTSWSNNGTSIYYNSSNYLAFLNGSWRLVSHNSGYYFSIDGYYLNLNGTTIESSQTPSTVWSATSGNIRAIGTSYYLYHSTSNGFIGSTSQRSWTNSGNSSRGCLYYRTTSNNVYQYYYIQFASHQFSVNGSTNSSLATQYPITFTSVSLGSKAKVFTTPNTILNLVEINTPNIYTASSSVTKNSNFTYFGSKDYSLTFSDMELQECDEADVDTVNGGNPTYFPLRVDKDETSGQYPTGWAASEKNTGYLISGANCEESSHTAAGQKKWGDIRIAGWSKSYISGSYSNSSFSTIYTINDTNSSQPTPLPSSVTEDDNYQEALSQFKSTLDSNTRVFGMHFMDATISKEHTIRARKAVLLGQTYYNYELPQDAIDFHVNTKGHISFFAGNYFYDTNTSAINDSFFSLHRIFRDENNDIDDIKEIVEIYQRKTNANRANYIYKFDDDTFTDPNGGYTGQTELDENYSLTPVFKTSWIKTPNNLATHTNNSSTTTDNRLFYFSIPCNSGEYALGSVPERTGAYLCYLDIAANGGDTVLSYMKEPTNATTFSYVDYRSSPNTSNHCVLEMGANIQASANAANLSISVTFDNSSATNANTPHSNGVYIIHVTNKTGTPIELSVLLIDDDDDLYNDFNYAYQIVYTNEDISNGIIEGEDIYEEYGELETVLYWKRMATFVIPSSGAAHESDYGANSP